MDEKKLRVYTTAVSIAGLSVFLLSLWEVYPYYLPGSSRGDIWSYSLMMVLLMVVVVVMVMVVVVNSGMQLPQLLLHHC